MRGKGKHIHSSMSRHLNSKNSVFSVHDKTFSHSLQNKLFQLLPKQFGHLWGLQNTKLLILVLSLKNQDLE